jgi:hypothetical protein
MSAPLPEPRPEARQAATWWASRLGNAVHDNGDRDASERSSTAFAAAATRLGGRVFTDEQRDAFRHELETAIEAHLQQRTSGINEGSWRPDEPLWGSALRCIAIDYHPHPVLQEAAERAGLPKLRTIDMPIKTVMWINPGDVKVAEGYSAPAEIVWQASQRLAARGEAS